MKICIDGRMMGAGNTRGIGRYIEELVKALVVVAPENEYTIIARSADHALKRHDCLQTVVADIPWYGAKEQIQLPRLLETLNVDLVHFPHWNVPLAYRKPFVVTIHDLLLKHQPASAKASLRAWPMRLVKKAGYGMALNYAIKASKQIIVPTEFVKKDLLGFYPQVSGKTVVTGEGLSHLPEADSAGLEYKYLLYVGSAYPHKRVEDLLTAWVDLMDEYADLHLVIAGEMDEFMQRVKAKAVDMGLARVEFLGRVSDTRLAGLYNNTLGFVFPSSFEGFGHPPLEAMAYGVPVICSDAGPMKEVLGDDGVVYFKTGSINGIINAVKTVVDNQIEYKNKVLAVQGKLQAKFSWKETAKRTLDAYKKAF